jgi:hypothetical protein
VATADLVAQARRRGGRDELHHDGNSFEVSTSYLLDALAKALEDTVAERDLAVRQLRAVRELLAELVADLADAVGANP